jgi:predicted secreted protein
MASVINGTNILLYQYDPITLLGVPFAAATNCTFSTSVDQVEITTTNSNSYKEYLGSQINWNISADGFIALSDYSYLFLLQKLKSKEQIVVKFQINNDNGDGSGTLGYSVVTGLVNIISLDMSGPVEGASTYSVSLQGTGAYTITGTQVSPSGVVVVGSNVLMFDYTAAGGETSITWTGAIGLGCVTVTRGGIEVRSISATGTPTGENVRFNTSTGVLTFAADRPLESDEFIRALFK